MDDATQKLVDELRGAYRDPENGVVVVSPRLLVRAADALEAAQRPPVGPEVDRLRAQVEAAREAWWSGTEQGDTGLVYTDRIEDAMDAIWDAVGHAEWTPRERPPVSPEQRDALARTLFVWDTDEHPDPRPVWSGLSEAQRDVWRSGANALLARFSLPVLDVEKVARFLYSLDPAIQGWNGDPYAYNEPNAKRHRDRAQQWAERLVEALPTLTANTERSTT